MAWPLILLLAPATAEPVKMSGSAQFAEISARTEIGLSGNILAARAIGGF